jgi:hypothetical protein
MKSVRIHRDAETGRLGYRVRDGQKIVQQELSVHTDIRKLRRHLRRTVGKSIIMEGLGS